MKSILINISLVFFPQILFAEATNTNFTRIEFKSGEFLEGKVIENHFENYVLFESIAGEFTNISYDQILKINFNSDQTIYSNSKLPKKVKTWEYFSKWEKRKMVRYGLGPKGLEEYYFYKDKTIKWMIPALVALGGTVAWSIIWPTAMEGYYEIFANGLGILTSLLCYTSVSVFVNYSKMVNVNKKKYPISLQFKPSRVSFSFRY